MSNYGRNFEFRVPPHSSNRSGRHFLNAGSSTIPIGAPVRVTDDGTVNALGLAPVTLETSGGDQTRPLPGEGGIAVYEYGPAAFAGDDPFLTTYSDKDVVPALAALQVVNGPDVKIVLRNTDDETFLNTREYTGRTMVAGSPATVTVDVGEYLTPGTGNDTAGYWEVTATAGDAWLVVTKVDMDRGEFECRLAF
jgi:hypothetical protein